MKIGIITLPLHINYGGILQAYALQNTLTKMGHSVVLIDVKQNFSLPLWKYPLVIANRFINKYFLGQKNIKIFKEKRYADEYESLSLYTQEFIHKYIATIKIKRFSDLFPDHFDCLVVGSDQIWRPLYYSNIENAYLKFAASWSIKRVAYAASFGTDEWEYNNLQTKKCKELLMKFDAISVRENSAVSLCKEYFHLQTHQVLDPTMLLDNNDYISLLKDQKDFSEEEKLLVYILDFTDDKRHIIQKIEKNKNCISLYVKNEKTENKNFSLLERRAYPVEDWLKGFINAKYVVTDSFHGCVFSILFNKPFILIANKERGLARFYSLLNTFNLNHLLITSSVELSNELLAFNVDWAEINTILKKQRGLSLEFLEKVINDK